MSQKSLITVTICMTVIFTIWGAEFAAFLQCTQ